MEMNKENLRKFRQDFAEAVSMLEAQYGVKIELGRINFDSTSFRGNLEVINLSNTGTSLKLQRILDAYPEFKAAYLKSFKEDGHTYTVVDYAENRTKYPVVCKREDGKSFCFRFNILTTRQFF